MGVLPFLDSADLCDMDGTPVSIVPCAIWPSDRAATEPGGRTFDHEGEAPLAHLAELKVANRYLLLNGIRYRVVTAIAHPYLPHVALTLRESVPTGS
jgi:hypothetical protein